MEMNKEINASEAVILRDNNIDAVFLDVREHSELAICSIEGASTSQWARSQRATKPYHGTHH
jgi:rhodanese-related sulfurtransferase